MSYDVILCIVIWDLNIDMTTRVISEELNRIFLGIHPIDLSDCRDENTDVGDADCEIIRSQMQPSVK